MYIDQELACYGREMMCLWLTLKSVEELDFRTAKKFG
jgi:hypothetical protein